MQGHALICKFIDSWLAKQDMEAWIKDKWELKVHVDLHIGVKGSLTMTFTNLVCYHNKIYHRA